MPYRKKAPVEALFLSGFFTENKAERKFNFQNPIKVFPFSVLGYRFFVEQNMLAE